MIDAWIMLVCVLRVQKHKQLAKGHDDLRQDAVMQQFFTLVNTLLNSNATTASRQLRIAVYRVVVFSSASGVVPSIPTFLVASQALTQNQPGLLHIESLSALHTASMKLSSSRRSVGKGHMVGCGV